VSFTFSHAIAASLAIHGALVLPFIAPPWSAPPEDPPILVVELQGVESVTQAEQKVAQQVKGEGNPQEAQAPAPETPPPQEAQQQQTPTPEEPQEPVADEGTLQQAPPPQPEQEQQEATPAQQTPAPEAAASAGSAGSANVDGATQQQQAQTIAEQQDEAERLRAYIKALTKKVQENLVYPDAGRRRGLKGTASVAFRLMVDGSVDPGSLKIATSSGQPQLDTSALKTVAASAPFDPPPRALTVTIAVVYGKVAKK